MSALLKRHRRRDGLVGIRHRVPAIEAIGADPDSDARVKELPRPQVPGIESPDLVAVPVEVIREMRHKGTSIMGASPVVLIELSSQMLLHKFNAPACPKHIHKANAALGKLMAEEMAHLRPGEACVWSSKATGESFTKTAVKVKLRPRARQHGGATKTAGDE